MIQQDKNKPNAKERMLKVLYNAINKGNDLEVTSAGCGSEIKPKFTGYIGKGNNSFLVRQVLKTRPWWVQAEREDFSEANLIWTQWKKNSLIQQLPAAENGHGDPKPIRTVNSSELRIYNKLEDNFHLANKKALFKHMVNYY